MGTDYTIYENWYKYMSNVFSQIQGLSGYPGQTYTGRTKALDQTFSNTFLRTLQQANAKQSQKESKAELSSSVQSMDAIFEEAARTYDVPLNLLKAIGKAESGFDANAVSPAGAQGVMQLMPSTAKSLGVDDPFDARSNIMGGAKYIAEKLKQYNGNIELALAAYNAGSGNVAKYGGVPPFKETRNYIARIKGYMNSDLTTGKTVEVQASAAARQTDVSAGAGDINGFLRTGLESAYRLSQTDAQYLMAMMRLQMLSRANGLSWLSADSDEQDWIL